MAVQMVGLDDAVIDVYCQRADTVDDILTDPPEAKAFADAVRAKLPPELAKDDRTILRRLITLRKRRGGLPAIAHRGSKPR